jgi:hypothetical protein
MHGLAALAAALSAAVAPAPGLVARPGALLERMPRLTIRVLPVERRSGPRSCSAQHHAPTIGGRRLLPVACEQPPRSSVNVPNLAGGISSLLGSGR